MRFPAKTLSILIIASALAGCTSESYDVRYEVTSNCDTVDVTYENGFNGTSQETVNTGEKDQNDEWIPWTYSFSTELNGSTLVYISGQSNCDGDNNDGVIVHIYIDDTLEVFDGCGGGYCTATASEKF